MKKTIRAEDSHTISDTSLIWVRRFAILYGILSLIGLSLLSWNSASAQTPPPAQKGFTGGTKTFTNPFANAPSDPFDDSDNDGADEAEVRAPQAPRGIQVGGQKDPNDVPTPQKTTGGITVGGEAGNGVVSSTVVSPLKVDSILGVGSKEIITDFNYPDADVMDIAKTIGKLTGKNFIFDKNVKGRISIVSNSPITVSDAWRAFLTALDINGFTLIPSGKYIRIARQRDARDKQLSTFVGDYSPDTDTLITRVFPLRYINSEEVARTFRGFMPANSRIIPYDQTNTVIVTDTGANIAKLAKMLEFLDVEGFDAGIEVVPVKFASAVELSKLIDTLLPGTQAAPQARGGARPSGNRGTFTARRTKEGGIINNIIADERTNTLIVHANNRGVEQVRELISKLDKRLPAPTGGGKIHVVYLQFANAEEVSKTLANLTQQSSTAPTTNRPGQAGASNPLQSSASLFEGQIRVSADKPTNSLVITASPQDFVTVQRVINKLDIQRDEVYVEAVIMEVRLGNEYNFSTNIALPTSGLASLPKSEDLMGFLTNPVAQSGLILGLKDGAKQSVDIAGKSVEVSGITGLIKAIQTNSRANVLATPQILTLDNTEATFETSENIPVPTSTVSQGTVSSSITKEKVSLSISIKPQINKVSNFVKLDIKTQLADISRQNVPAALAQQAFGTFERKAETSVVVADTDTVVLGGLVRDKEAETINKIPILGDIPLLGWLFKSKETTVEKTNLLIFITPTIVRQYEKVRALLDKKLKQRDDYLEANAGGEDPMRHYRDEMIRDLPNIDEVLSKKPEQPFTNEIGGDTPSADAAQDNGSPFKGDAPKKAENAVTQPAPEAQPSP